MTHYKSLYMAEKAKKLKLEDENKKCLDELEKLQCKIVSRNAEIFNLGKENKALKEGMEGLESYNKRLEIRVAAREADKRELEDKLRPDWLKTD